MILFSSSAHNNVMVIRKKITKHLECTTVKRNWSHSNDHLDHW